MGIPLPDPVMASKGAKSKPRAPQQTFEEVNYLRRLADEHIRVRVRLADNQEFSGVVEFFDSGFIRLTRDNGPNLFLYKHDIKYLYEDPESGS